MISGFSDVSMTPKTNLIYISRLQDTRTGQRIRYKSHFLFYKYHVLGFQLFDSSLILRDEDRGKELFCAWPVVGVFREHPSNGIQDF